MSSSQQQVYFFPARYTTHHSVYLPNHNTINQHHPMTAINHAINSTTAAINHVIKSTTATEGLFFPRSIHYPTTCVSPHTTVNVSTLNTIDQHHP
jgi:hypothetical protein